MSVLTDCSQQNLDDEKKSEMHALTLLFIPTIEEWRVLVPKGCP